jgi:hypothetical protein
MSQMRTDGLCNPALTLMARQLLSLVCVKGGAACPMIEEEEAREVLERMAEDPTLSIQLCSDAESLPHYSVTLDDPVDPEDAINRKRDLDVLQRLGLCIGDTRRARYLIELLYERIETPAGICSFDTPGWEGCELAHSGAYESARDSGWAAIVHCRSAEEMAEFRARNERDIAEGDRICMRPHHLMCMSCWYNGGKATGTRGNDTLAEILARMQQEPDVPITLIEGPCQACDCCDGFEPTTGRCVHACGLIRDYKKDLDVFQKMGLMPGATLPAREVMELLFERVESTTDICGCGTGIATATEWRVCGGPDGNAGYIATRQTGIFAEEKSG